MAGKWTTIVRGLNMEILNHQTNHGTKRVSPKMDVHKEATMNEIMNHQFGVSARPYSLTGLFSPLFSSCTILLLTLLLVGCGNNLLESSEKKDPAQDALLALEDDNPDEAIKILEEALTNDDENVVFKAILAMAYAQRAGVLPLDLAENMASSDSSSSEGNSFSLLYAIMPDPDAQNLADITNAVELMLSIPDAQRISADIFSLAIYQTAALVMQVKVLDEDGDGVISPYEAANMSMESAEAFLNNLDQAQAFLQSSAGDSVAIE